MTAESLEPIGSTQLKLSIGQRIKRLRKQRRLTLDQMARLTRLSASLHSQIEQGKVNLSIANLWKISQALDVQIAAFFQQHDPSEEFELIRREQRQVISPSHADHDFSGYTYTPVASLNPKGTVEIFEVTSLVFPEEDMKFNTHSGVELTCVIAGRMEFIAKEGSQEIYRTILSPGDLLRFPATYPHAYRAIGQEPARLMGILYPSREQRLARLSGPVPGLAPHISDVTGESEEAMNEPRADTAQAASQKNISRRSARPS